MKLRPVTKLDKDKHKTAKQIDSDVVLVNYDANLIFLVDGSFGTIQNPDSGHIVFNFNISINSNLLSLEKLKAELKNL